MKPKSEIFSDGTDMFVVVDGVKVAKGGRPGTPQAKTWVPLEPGWSVLDTGDRDGLAIEYNGVTVQ